MAEWFQQVINGPRAIGIVSLLGAGFLFGISGMLTKYLTGILTAFHIFEYKFLISLIGFLIFIIATRKKIHFSNIDKKTLTVYSIFFPFSVIFFALAIAYSSVVLATAAACGSVVVVSFFLGFFVLKESISPAKTIGFILTLIALILFTNPFGNFELSLGLLFGIMCGASQSLANLVQRVISDKKPDIGSLLILQSLVAIIGGFILYFTNNSLAPNISLTAWLMVILMGVCGIAVISLIFIGFKHTDLNTGAVLISIEVFFGPILTVAFLGEIVSTNILIGGGVVFSAVVITNLPDRYMQPQLEAIRNKVLGVKAILPDTLNETLLTPISETAEMLLAPLSETTEMLLAPILETAETLLPFLGNSDETIFTTQDESGILLPIAEIIEYPLPASEFSFSV